MFLEWLGNIIGLQETALLVSAMLPEMFQVSSSFTSKAFA